MKVRELIEKLEKYSDEAQVGYAAARPEDILSCPIGAVWYQDGFYVPVEKIKADLSVWSDELYVLLK